MRNQGKTLALLGGVMACLLATGAGAETLGEMFVYRFFLKDAMANRQIPRPDQPPTSTTYTTRPITLKEVGYGTDLQALGFLPETSFAIAGGKGGGLLGGGPLMTWPGTSMQTFCQLVYQLNQGFECTPGISEFGSPAGVIITAPGDGLIQVVSSVFGDNVQVNPPKLFGSNTSQVLVSNTYGPKK